MAPSASWKGYLKLSLVSCPVRLYPATSASERITFNQLHKKTHNRINMKPVDPELGLVERSDLVKGYEYEDKQYVIIEDSDLEAVRIESNHTMNIEAFVDEGSVDVIYQDAPYYLAPDGAMAEETFVVLREAMRKSGKLAIARLVLSSRERVITIGARESGMFVCTLRNPSEVRGTAEYFATIPDGKPDPEMLQLAEALIKQKETDLRSQELRGSLRDGADVDDPREAQGPQADHRGGARARQCHQPDGCAEGEPFAIEAAGKEQEQGRGRRKPAAKVAAAGGGARPRPRAGSDGGLRQDLRNIRRAVGAPATAGGEGSQAAVRPAEARRLAPHLELWSSAASCSTRQPKPTSKTRYDAEVQGRTAAAQRERFSCGCSVWPNRVERRELTRQSLLDQSRLEPRLFDLLSLFDAFEQRRGTLLLPRSHPGEEICRPGRRRRELERDRAVDPPLRPGRIADRDVAAGRGRGHDLCRARRRCERTQRPACLRSRHGRRRQARRTLPRRRGSGGRRPLRGGGRALSALPRHRSHRRRRRLQPGKLPARSRPPCGGRA